MSIKRVLNTKWVIIFFLFAMFPPRYFDQNDTVKALLNGLKIIASIAVTLLYSTNIKTHSKKLYNIIFTVLWVEILVSTLFSADASIYVYTTQAINTLIPCFLIGVLAIHSPVNGIKAMYYYFSTCVLINTITFILFPGALYADTGGWRCWILGDDNTGYSFYIVASTLAMVYSSNIKGKITLPCILVWISGFVFAFGRGIGSGMICQVIWAILFIIYNFRKLRQFIKARYIFYITAGGFFGIAVFRTLIFESIATAVGKDITLSGRTQLWESVLKMVVKRPLIGYGVIDGETFNRLLNTTVNGAHNQILMLLLWGGMTAGIIFALLLCAAIKNATKARQSSFYKCVVIGIVVISIRLFVENGNNNHLYFLLTLLAYSPQFTLGLKPESVISQRKKSSTLEGKYDETRVQS